MPKLRLAIKKEGSLQFLSHLDYARAVRYVIIRAGLPVCYSEGFNPHMKINFASALGVGVSAAVEYMDMDLLEEIPSSEVIQRMNGSAPDGFGVLDAEYIPDKSVKLMALANYAVYDLRGPVMDSAVSDSDIATILTAFYQNECVVYEKVSPKTHRKKQIDVKQHVPDPITGQVADGSLILTVGILQTAEGGIKPIQLWEVLADQFALPVYPNKMLAHRKNIYHRIGTENLSLFDVVPK